MCSIAKKIYKGYIDDRRNTDNAWIEAEIWNFHYDKDNMYKDCLFFPLDHISGGTFLCLNIKNGNFGLLLNNNFSENDV